MFDNIFSNENNPTVGANEIEMRVRAREKESVLQVGGYVIEESDNLERTNRLFSALFAGLFARSHATRRQLASATHK